MEQIDYFKEIEGAFVRRRGRNLLLSPVDWALMESWEKRGVPLRIILTTIDEVFDRAGSDPERAASIRSLSYCRDAVEARYRNWREARVGADSLETADDVTMPEVEEGLGEVSGGSQVDDHLAAAISRLGSLIPTLSGTSAAAASKAVDLLSGAVDKGGVSAEEVLDRADRLIDDVLFDAVQPDAMVSALEQAGNEAGEKPAAMEEGEYRRAAELLVRKKLRDESGIPRLGLFHL